MKKFLTSHGNTWQLYINKPIAQLLGITSGDYTVNLEIKNKVLYVKKISQNEFENYKDLLCKKLIKRNSSYGLNIPVPILELLEINPETDMVDFEIDGVILIIRKANKKGT